MDGAVDRSRLLYQSDISDLIVLLWGCYLMAIYIFRLLLSGQCSIQRPRDSILHGSVAKVSLCDFLPPIRFIWELTRYGLQEKTELLILSF